MDKCINEGCENERTPGDFREMCLACNPYGDSPAMNLDPSYLSWCNRWED